MNVQVDSLKKKTALDFALNTENEDMVKLVLIFGHHLQDLRKNKVENERILALLKAGGFTGRRCVRGRGRFTTVLTDEFLTSQSKGDLNLKHECRKVIRWSLFAAQFYQNIIYKVCQLGLPSILEEYLLFGVSLD